MHSRVSVTLLLYIDARHRFHGLAKITSTTVATTMGAKFNCVITITSIRFTLRIAQSPFVCSFNRLKNDRKTMKWEVYFDVYCMYEPC